MALVKFISGDGVEHEVEETSVAADIMRQNGFQRVYSEAEAAEQAKSGRQLGAAKPKVETETVDLSKLGRPALIAEAMEAPPGGVDAGRAVRAAPGAGGRHEPRDQEGHEERQHSCQADRFCHNVTETSRSHSLRATPIIGHERRSV